MGKIPHNLHKCINCALTECNGGGSKCDTCGHLESAKQLSGYANVKGVYTPQTTGAAQAAKASTIPQTSDDMPIIPIVVISIAALLGLGVTAYLKKKQN